MPVIGLSKMFRIPYKHSLTDMIRHDQQPDNKRLDLCEVLFGTVHGIEGKQSFKGRIQVGHAFATQQVGTNQLLKVNGLLGQPKASYYPLYVKQDKNPYKTYDTGTRLSGRKLYRIHKGGSTTDLPRGNDNANVANNFYALPAGNTFVLRINVHNLKKAEIGALLSALTLNEAAGAFHNLGLAKSYGYGKIQIDDIKLYHLSFSVKEYEAAFEDVMDAFVAEHIKPGLKWRETEQVLQLTNILREHDDHVVKLMQLGDSKTEGTYGYYKDKRNFKGTEIDRLTETRNKV
jgi:CRISPR-associated protein (TIGR03986 family)